MLSKINKALKNLTHGQKGMTGLETAIILIAFVTVASVLAYSVLSAGIFSSEKGKETVYSGLQQAQSTLEIKSSVLGLSTNGSRLDQVQFNVALSIPTQSVDSTAVVVNYWDNLTHTEGATFTLVKAAGSTERGSPTMIEGDEEFTCTVDIPSGATLLPYDTFNIQVVPPTGASLTITRTLPGVLDKVMNLN